MNGLTVISRQNKHFLVKIYHKKAPKSGTCPGKWVFSYLNSLRFRVAYAARRAEPCRYVLCRAEPCRAVLSRTIANGLTVISLQNKHFLVKSTIKAPKSGTFPIPGFKFSAVLRGVCGTPSRAEPSWPIRALPSRAEPCSATAPRADPEC